MKPNSRPIFAAMLLAALVAGEALAQDTGPALSPAQTGDQPQGEGTGPAWHFSRGVELFEAGDLPGALYEFRLSYDAHPHFKVRYNIGKILLLLERYVEAEKELEAYMAEGGDQVDEEKRTEVQAILDEIPSFIGQVVLSCKVIGAQVWVDGKLMATLPVTDPIRMNAGEHVIQITAGGYETSSKKVTVPGGAVKEFKVVLVPLSPAPGPPRESTVEQCTDFIDNDSDGYADCQDQDCWTLTICMQEVVPSESQPPPKKKRKGTFGLYGSVMAVGRPSQNIEGTWFWSGPVPFESATQTKLKPAGGFGIFAEGFIKPYFTMGADVFLAFPEVDTYRMKSTTASLPYEWSGWEKCPECKRNIAFSAMLRMRLPLRAGRWVAFYPLVGIGIGVFTDRRKDEYGEVDRRYFCMTYAGGLGVEFHTPVPVTPFVEMRYLGGFGANTDKRSIPFTEIDTDRIVVHSMVLNFGLGFL